MVRPPKSNDIKQSIPAQKSHTKPLKSEIEERYRMEAPVHNKISDKLKSSASSPGSSIRAKPKNASIQKSKSVSPKSSKLSKVLSQQPASNITKRSTLAQSKSHKTKSDNSTSPKQRLSVRKPSIIKKKISSEAKSDPMNRLLKITETDDHDITSLPMGFTTDNVGKIKPRISKLGKVITGTKKVVKKSSLKKAPKEPQKNLNFNLKQEESVASLTTHFRMPYLSHELHPTTLHSSKLSANKKLRTSTIQKKTSRSKADQEDTTKDGKNKRKSKLYSLKHLNRVLSSDSDPVFPVKEIKHNDSFIISARKFEKSSSERRDRKRKPDCLKLCARSSSSRAKPTDCLPRKSCLKKTLEGETKISEEEGKMRFHQTFYTAQIV